MPARSLLPTRHLHELRRITPEPLNVAPQLVGLHLASPARRAWAMLIDVTVVGLLSQASGFWLAGGLALVLLQLRSRGTLTPQRQAVGWVAAGVFALLALLQAAQHWDTRDERAQTRAEARAAATVATVEQVASAAVAGDAAALQARVTELEDELDRLQRHGGWGGEVDRLLDGFGVTFGWGIVYFSLLPAWWNGQTVGKKLLRLRVVELTGAPMTVLRSLRRYGGYAAGMATGGIGFLQMLWDPNRQALQDRAAHTAVIDVRHDAA